MIEKLNFREVENGAHGAQSTVVEGASLTGDFRVVFYLCFKASPGVKPFIWKFVLFSYKFWLI